MQTHTAHMHRVNGGTSRPSRPGVTCQLIPTFNPSWRRWCNHHRHRPKTTQIRASSSFNESEHRDPERRNQEDPTTSSSSSSPTPTGGAVAIPAGVPPAGAVFILAGFLKILIVCFPYSTMAISMFLQGRADLGAWAAAKMLPIALGLVALAKVALDRKLHERKWFHRGIVVASVAALLVSRAVFARPRPSPLDPLIAAHQREMAVALAEQRRQQAASEIMGQHRVRLMETSEAARKELEQRSAGGRFSGSSSSSK